jgi:hypothetical protein
LPLSSNTIDHIPFTGATIGTKPTKAAYASLGVMLPIITHSAGLLASANQPHNFDSEPGSLPAPALNRNYRVPLLRSFRCVQIQIQLQK